MRNRYFIPFPNPDGSINEAQTLRIYFGDDFIEYELPEGDDGWSAALFSNMLDLAFIPCRGCGEHIHVPDCSKSQQFGDAPVYCYRCRTRKLAERAAADGSMQ